MPSHHLASQDTDHTHQAREQRRRFAAEPDTVHDFIVCGAGASGSVIARRLAENPDARVLLIEAGGSDEAASVLDPAQWPTNLGSERDWGFQAEPNPHLHGRALSMSMGKGLGGGSSVNVMVWARGHRDDWDFFASEAGDAAWGYQSVLEIYRRIENWRGTPDPRFRGTDGPVWVQPAHDPHPLAHAMLGAARELGIPTFESPNGAMMEGPGGAALTDMLVRDGQRHSLYRAYVHPWSDRSNLTILTGAQVRRVLFDGRRARAVEVEKDGRVLTIGARCEIILSAGAINTPKLLMLSGIGDRAELERHSIPVLQHLPGVGRNMQDHVSFGCTWECKEPIAPRNSGSEATLYWKSRPELESPDLLFCQVEFPVPSDRTAALGVPEHGWTMFAGLAQPKSRGRLRLRDADPAKPPVIDANMLSDPADLEAARACVRLCRALGNAEAFKPHVTREAIPGVLDAAGEDAFIRDSAVTYWHQCGTAKMGRDDMSVVDSSLSVHGVEGIRVADGSIMPRVTTGNTQAPCAIIGEQAAARLRARHGL
ncbi:oxidoreductase [Skermanella stibiiresistens SB22]|uniref:Oxidoreductase n=1 Tax=Skermanella stibiiresistens SB22 TaxID=1385369 RepID=W9H0E0_9PROT|nr:GMC family oxidoreductase N-terminal domain-containing protein [Skermanella stibiiresistens]EWY38311.1 oxidoreductase [Skermanella stibiiresistens SB22]